MSYQDPMDAATQVGNRVASYYGKMDVSATFVKLTKGVGAEQFNELTDDMKDRRTQVIMVLQPIDASNMILLIERKWIAEFPEWSKLTWASLRDNCKLKNVRELHGKWAKVEMIGTGRMYTNKRGQTTEETTFRFLAVFNTAAEATAAYYAELGTAAPEDNGVMDVDMSHQAGAPATNVSQNGNGANIERDTALQFLGALVKQAGGDKNKLGAMIAQMPMISKYFTVDSPEVVSLFAGVR